MNISSNINETEDILDVLMIRQSAVSHAHTHTNTDSYSSQYTQ